MDQALPLVAVALSNLIPVFLWMWLYTSRDPSREPRILLLFAFLIGGIATVPVMFVNSFIGGLGPQFFPHQLLFMVTPVLLAALVEEVCKHCGVMFVMQQDRLANDEILDGITYAVVTALGFAFVENTVYTWIALWGAGTVTWDVVMIYVLRGILSTFAHTIFSGFFGFYYALGFIEPKLATARKVGRRISKMSAWQLLLEGLLLAVVLHMLYNLFLTWPPFGQTAFVVVTPYLLVLGAVLMWIIYGVRQKL